MRGPVGARFIAPWLRGRWRWLLIAAVVAGAGIGGVLVYRDAASKHHARGWKRKLPPYTVELPAANGWDLYVQAAELARQVPPFELLESLKFVDAVATEDSESIAAYQPTAETAIERGRPALDLLRQARNLPCAHAPPDRDDRQADMAAFEVMKDCRGLARLESIHMSLAHLNGADTEVLDAVEDTLALGVGFASSGRQFDAFAGATILRIGAYHGTLILGGGLHATRERLLQHASSVRDIHRRQCPLARIVHYECDDSLYILEHIGPLYDQGAAEAEARGNAAQAEDSRRERDIMQRLAPDLFAYVDTWSLEAVAEGSRPLWEMDLSGLMARGRAEVQHIGTRDGASEAPEVLRWVLPSLERDPDMWKESMPADAPEPSSFLDRLRRFDAALSAEEVAGLLAAYRVDRGEYPLTLDGLVPGYTDAIPLDPWTGKSILYRREGPTDYVLYCAGPDRVDGGGEGDPWRVGTPDYVLIRPRTP